MKKNLLALFLLVAVFASSSSAQTYSLTRPDCRYTPERAAMLWWISWDAGVPDTLISVFILRSFTIAADGQTMTVAFDSVKGRGGTRRIRMTLSQKDADSTNWVHEMERDSATFYLPPDTVISNLSSWRKEHIYTTVRTTDSTCRVSSWVSPWDGINYELHSWRISDSTSVQVGLHKVLGDPTMYYGRNQRALLRVRAKPTFLPAALDSLLRRPN